MSDSEIVVPPEFIELIKKRDSIQSAQNISHKQVQDLQKIARSVSNTSTTLPILLGPQTKTATPAAEVAAVLPILEQELAYIRKTETSIQSLEAEIQQVEQQERSRRITMYAIIIIAIFLCVLFLIFAVGH